MRWHNNRYTLANELLNRDNERSERRQMVYNLVCSYNTYKEALQHVSNEGFRKHEFKQTIAGRKIFFRCGKVKQRSKNQCEAKRMIFESNTKTDFEIHESSSTHTCDKIDEEQLSKTISKEMKEMIIACSEKRMTPKFIVAHIDELREQHGLFIDEKTPAMRQIYYIASSNKTTKTPKIMDLGELIEWAEANTNVPEEIDHPFVIGFNHSDEDEELRFQIVVSTRRMIDHCAKQKIVCVDATYKLNYQGYPFIVVGAIDRTRKFHPLCFALCSNETEFDYTFVFESLANAVEKFTGLKFESKIIISDAADAIQNAAKAVFPAAGLVMCYVHVIRNVEKQKFHNKENKKRILKDINILQLSPFLLKETWNYSYANGRRWKMNLQHTSKPIGSISIAIGLSPMRITLPAQTMQSRVSRMTSNQFF